MISHLLKEFLTSRGYDKSLHSAGRDFLNDQEIYGQWNEAWREWLIDQGYDEGNLQESLKKWEKDPTLFSLLYAYGVGNPEYIVNWEESSKVVSLVDNNGYIILTVEDGAVVDEADGYVSLQFGDEIDVFMITAGGLIELLPENYAAAVNSLVHEEDNTATISVIDASVASYDNGVATINFGE